MSFLTTPSRTNAQVLLSTVSEEVAVKLGSTPLPLLRALTSVTDWAWAFIFNAPCFSTELSFSVIMEVRKNEWFHMLWICIHKIAFMVSYEMEKLTPALLVVQESPLMAITSCWHLFFFYKMIQHDSRKHVKIIDQVV